MDHHAVSAHEVLAAFESDPDRGLRSDQIEDHLRDYGTNTFTKAPRDSALLRCWRAATEPMLLMLVAAGGIALGVNTYRAATGADTDFFEVIGVFTAIFLSVAITVFMEDKSARAFDALNSINENMLVRAIRDDRAVMIGQELLVCGDIVRLAIGDRVPADGRIIESSELTCDESALTGESDATFKGAEPPAPDRNAPLAERTTMLFSGTYITSGFCTMVVTAVGDATEFGRIARELGQTECGRTPLQEKLARLGRLITVIGIIAAGIVFSCELASFAAAGTLDGGHVMDAFLTSIVLIVAAVPEGLPTIVAVSLSLSVIKLSRRHALVRKMLAAETIGCVNVICSDKTGTLTENRMTVREIWCAGTAPGSVRSGRAQGALEALGANESADRHLIENFCINSTADIDGDGGFIGSPTEGALLVCARRRNVDYRAVRSRTRVVRVFPFSSNEKHMTTLVARPDGATGFVKGSPERVLDMCASEPGEREEIERLIRKAQTRAFRVLAFAHRDLRADEARGHDDIERDMVFDAFVCIADPLRPDVGRAVRACRDAGVELKILTGDDLANARAIAAELGVLDGGKLALDAGEIERMDDGRLGAALPRISVIARSTPAIKLRVVRLLRSLGEVVAVTGDGVNDAPALSHADVGIAMGISGTEVSKEASDILLLDDSFSTIVQAIQWGRGVYENFRRFISFQLTVNVASIATVLGSILLGDGAPFSALQLLWINIIMDGPPALTLGLEPSCEDLLNRPPTPRHADIVDRALLVRIVTVGIFVSAVVLAQGETNFLGAAPSQEGTVIFALFTLFQLFNAFNCRELHASSIFGHLLRNRIMLGIVGLTLLLQVLIIQFAGAFFNTVPLPLDLWLRLSALAASVVALSEFGRLAVRVARRRQTRAASREAVPVPRAGA